MLFVSVTVCSLAFETNNKRASKIGTGRRIVDYSWSSEYRVDGVVVNCSGGCMGEITREGGSYLFFFFFIVWNMLAVWTTYCRA